MFIYMKDVYLFIYMFKVDIRFSFIEFLKASNFW